MKPPPHIALIAALLATQALLGAGSWCSGVSYVYDGADLGGGTYLLASGPLLLVGRLGAEVFNASGLSVYSLLAANDALIMGGEYLGRPFIGVVNVSGLMGGGSALAALTTYGVKGAVLKVSPCAGGYVGVGYVVVNGTYRALLILHKGEQPVARVLGCSTPCYFRDAVAVNTSLLLLGGLAVRGSYTPLIVRYDLAEGVVSGYYIELRGVPSSAATPKGVAVLGEGYAAVSQYGDRILVLRVNGGVNALLVGGGVKHVVAKGFKNQLVALGVSEGVTYLVTVSSEGLGCAELPGRYVGIVSAGRASIKLVTSSLNVSGVLKPRDCSASTLRVKAVVRPVRLEELPTNYNVTGASLLLKGFPCPGGRARYTSTTASYGPGYRSGYRAPQLPNPLPFIVGALLVVAYFVLRVRATS